MTDPLSVLRQYIINKMDIMEHNDQIIFGEYAWPRDVRTNYLTYKAMKKGGTKEYYTLECLLFFLKNLDLVHPEYCNVSATAHIQAVGRPDRKILLKYLKGEIDSSASIDKNAPTHAPIKLI